MGGGYVLDFSNRTFAELFRDLAGIDIYDDKYAIRGESKANRLRAFWSIEPDMLVGRVLFELIKHWRYLGSQAGKAPRPALDAEVTGIARRLMGERPSAETSEADFLKQDFGDIRLDKLRIEPSVIPVLELRFAEARACLAAKAPLSVIFMCGSILEGALLGAAQRNPKAFNQATNSPRDGAGKPKHFHEWRLAELIDVACTLGLLDLDVKKFSHALRDFRNYIHPYQQMASLFAPDEHTARICLQVLRAALADLSQVRP
jgi:hypothetical protein